MYKEGSVSIVGDAFINEKAKLTRDISIAIANYEISHNNKISSVLDPTAASGIRGMRYMKENDIKNADFLEINELSYTSLKKNLKLNKVEANAHNISIQEFANTTKNKYDLIDLDPFGGISPYIFDMMKIVKDNTLLFATITDTAVLCGAHTNACLKLYGAVPLHNEICHEVGLRILIGYIARIASSFNFGVEVYLSMVYKHYMRVWIKLHYNSIHAVNSIKNLGVIYFCSKCGMRGSKNGLNAQVGNCELCNSKLVVGGPLWVGRTKNNDVIKNLIKELDSMNLSKEDKKIIDTLSKESDETVCYSISHITHRLGLGSVKQSYLIDELIKNGYNVSITHYNPNMIRTDAPYKEIIEVVKKLYLERISH